MGYVKPAIHAKDTICRKQDGRRILTYKKENLEKVRPPSYIHFGHYRFWIEYEGQEKTCSYCSEPGHLVRDCRYRIQNQAKTSHTSEDQQNHTTTEGITFTQNNPDATDEPDPTPAESVQPRYNKVQHSTPANKQQTKGNAIEKQLFDLFDGSPLATSITEETTPQRQRDIAAAYSNRENQQRQKSTKRRERTPNNSSDEKPPPRKHKEHEDSETDSTGSDDTSTVFNSSIDEGTSKITCKCGAEVMRPTANEKIECPSCLNTWFLCHCDDNNLQYTNRYRQFQCDVCTYSHVPDEMQTNHTL
ncbi:unnamed protein product [Clavelina lepadiformis]